MTFSHPTDRVVVLMADCGGAAQATPEEGMRRSRLLPGGEAVQAAPGRSPGLG
jgi:hypothetical protein